MCEEIFRRTREQEFRFHARRSGKTYTDEYFTWGFDPGAEYDPRGPREHRLARPPEETIARVIKAVVEAAPRGFAVDMAFISALRAAAIAGWEARHEATFT
ncbi:hypothetical protein ACFQ1E_17565 [Sphingomonas canadensis]|uniref:Uncharacterized protein n=1 Tax=Sphingomonas canadensis TaxID=1219257 RepID=A0ABW3H9J3_9SPHN|nr:hypothetical protein [Sphingomonas canadensis]MCW3837856.1 hypothetical protein [Sphingomonas canadensis]